MPQIALELEEMWARTAGRGEYPRALREYREYLSWLECERRKVIPLSHPPLEDEEVVPKARLCNSFLLGCDPEFVVLDDRGRVVNVEGTIPQMGPVGWDHSGNVIETRPKPARGTYMLLKHLQRLIGGNPTLKPLEGLKWRAGAAVKAAMTRPSLTNDRGERLFTLGGHVHFDQNPPEHRDGDPEDHSVSIKACDRVTQVLEQLDILPRAESQTRRTDPTAVRNKYGQFSDWRVSGEAHERWEYRTPASWLYAPQTAFVVLTAMKLAAVAPAVALEMLKRTGGWSNLRAFFEAFSPKDSNAQRVVERLMEGKTVKDLQFSPDCNFRERWERLGV